MGWSSSLLMEEMTMPRAMQLALDDAQRTALEAVRDHHRLPYMRERAAALLKVADGQSEREVARMGLLKPRWFGTIAAWVTRYKAGGIAGLVIRPGRGRKPAFSPTGTKRRQRTD
jgi:hypothetical protein